MKRRDFLFHAGALTAAASFGQLGAIAARATNAEDYKALVCLFLIGGNDSNNMIVPLDSAYAGYATARANLALQPVEPAAPAGNRRCTALWFASVAARHAGVVEQRQPCRGRQCGQSGPALDEGAVLVDGGTKAAVVVFAYRPAA